MDKPAWEIWNTRYAAGHFPTHPSPSLVAHATRLPSRGRALDLPCGAGRNTLFLAERGLVVDAWDASVEGIARVREAMAALPDLAPRVHPQVVDVEVPDFTLPVATWDLIVVVNYLHRPLLPQLRRALRPGGWLFYETFVDVGPLANRHRPEHVLRPGELAAAFADWEVAVSLEEPEHSRALVIARRPTDAGREGEGRGR